MFYQQPDQSPWGNVQTCDVLCPGVFLVSTSSHGGTMVAKDMAAVLSSAAIKCGFRHSGFLCFEEDTQEDVQILSSLFLFLYSESIFSVLHPVICRTIQYVGNAFKSL